MTVSIAAAAQGRVNRHCAPGSSGSRANTTALLRTARQARNLPAGHCSSTSAAEAVAAAVYDTWFDTWEEYSDAEDDDDIIQQVRLTAMHASPTSDHYQQQPVSHDPVLSHQELFQEASLQQQAAVHFSLVQQIEYGQFFRIVGSAPCLGSWEPSNGPDMSWHKGHIWSVDIALPAGQHEFKYVLVHRSGHLQWEPGSNRVVDVPATAAELDVQGPWAATDNTKVHIKQQRLATLQPEGHDQQQVQPQLSGRMQLEGAASKPRPFKQPQQQQPPLQSSAEARQKTYKVPTQQKEQSSVTDAAQQSLRSLQQTASTPPASWSRSPDAALPTGPAAAAVVPSTTLVLTDSQQKLVQQLTLQQQELSISVASIKAEVHEMEAELDFLHEELAHITAERILQQQQQQEGWTPTSLHTAAAPAGLGVNGGDDDVSIWSGLAAQALANAGKKSAAAQQQQLDVDLMQNDLIVPGLREPDTQYWQPRKSQLKNLGTGSTWPSNGSSPSSSSSSVDDWQQSYDDLLLDPQDAALLKQLDMIAGRTSSSSRHSRSQSSSDNEDAVLLPHLSYTPAAGVSTPSANERLVPGSPSESVDCAVLSWRQGLLSLRHDALLLQADLTAVDDSISSVQQQLAANTTAVIQQESKRSVNGKRSKKNNRKGGKVASTAVPSTSTAGKGFATVAVAAATNSAAAADGKMQQGTNSSSSNSKSSRQKKAGSSSSGGGSKSPNPKAPVAGNVAEYQRLLLQRFNELTDHISANLESSVGYLRAADEDSQQQQGREVGSAAFAAAHHAAAAAYAAGDATDSGADTTW